MNTARERKPSVHSAYPGLSYEEYANIDGLSFSSDIKPLLVSGKAWKNREKKKPTKATTLGSAEHCAILEPEKFRDRYVVFDGDRRKKEFKEFKEEHDGKTILSSDDYCKIKTMADAIYSDKHASRLLLEPKHERELSMQWEDPDTQLVCKGRIDSVTPNTLLDIKTTTCDFRPFLFDFFMRRNYQAQLAFYRDGFAAITNTEPDISVIAVQNRAPWDVFVIKLSDSAIDDGRQKYKSALWKFMECIRNNDWSGETGGSYLRIGFEHGTFSIEGDVA
jgi:hypothetical protein